MLLNFTKHNDHTFFFFISINLRSKHAFSQWKSRQKLLILKIKLFILVTSELLQIFILICYSNLFILFNQKNVTISNTIIKNHLNGLL